MDSYNLSYTPGFEQQKRLSDRPCQAVQGNKRVGCAGASPACRRVADVFSEICSADLLVLDAGRYGFVKLQYFHPPFGYDEAGIFTTGKDLFNDLWNEWLTIRLLALTKGTPLADLDYQYMFQCLPAEKHQEFMDKRGYFLDRSGITL